MEGQSQQCRLSRLAKQAEFDFEESAYTPSPVTIHIEDGCEESNTNSDCLNYENCSEEHSSFPNQLSVEENDSQKPEKDLSSGRSHGQSKSSGRHLLVKQSSSQGSIEGSSPSLSRDSSTETYTDSTGIDLQQFILDTLYKSQKDRMMLLKIEQDLITLVKDTKCQSFKFSPMSSYNRMLVHRVAAFFGLEHNVDKTGMSVIVNKTKNTRMPDFRFQEHIRDELIPEEPKKLILKRDSASFEEGKESPDRQSSLDSKRSKSFEEREEEYEKARARIFNQDEGYGESPYSRSQDGTLSSSRRSSQEDLRWMNETRPWSSTDSDSSGRKGESFDAEGASKAGNKAMVKKPATDQNEGVSNSVDLLGPPRPVVSKASSFGGISLLTREPDKTQKLNKAESFNSTPSYSLPSPGNTTSSEPSIKPTPPASLPLPVSPQAPVIPNPTASTTSQSNNGISPAQGPATTQISVVRPENQLLPTNSTSSSQNGKREAQGSHYWNGGVQYLPTARPPEPVSIAASVICSPISTVNPVACQRKEDNQLVKLSNGEPVRRPSFSATPAQAMVNTNGLTNGSHMGMGPTLQQAAAAAAFQQHQQGNIIYIPFLSSNHHQLQHHPQSNNQIHLHRNVFPVQPERPIARLDSELANQMSSLSFNQHDGKSQHCYYPEKEPRFGAQQSAQQHQQIPLCIQQLPTNPQCCTACPPNMQNKDAQDNQLPGHQFLQGYSFISLNPQDNFVSVPYLGYPAPNLGMSPNLAIAQHPPNMAPPHSQSGPSMVVANPHTAVVTSPSSNPTPPTGTVGSPVSVLTSPGFPYVLNGPNSSQAPRGPIYGGPPLCFVGNCASNNGYPTNVMQNNPAIGYTFLAQPMHQQQQHSHQQNGTYPFMPTLHLLRPSIPVIGHNATQNIIPPQLATPPPPQPQQQHHPPHQNSHKGTSNNPRFLPFGKNSVSLESSDHQIKGLNMKGSSGVNLISGGPVRFPPNPAYHHGIRPMQDVHLLSGSQMGGAGFNKLMFRPPRFPPPPVQFQSVPVGASSRGSPKMRKPHRSRWSAPPLPPRTSAPNTDDSYRGNVLEVEGIPEGLKRGEVERYLESVTQAGAKLHFPNDSKCEGVLNSVGRGPPPRGTVLAIFETAQAAQSALLNIKTPKFQLRSTNRHRPTNRS